jgi:hypothetical protein
MVERRGKRGGVLAVAARVWLAQEEKEREWAVKEKRWASRPKGGKQDFLFIFQTNF